MGADIRLTLGWRAERAAVALLKAQGYVIEAVNVRTPLGELDAVAWEGTTLCFVEVRSTTSRQWGGPLASIGCEKRRHLARAAQWYLKRYRRLPEEIRFDVMAVVWEEGRRPAMELVRGAFTLDDY